MKYTLNNLDRRIRRASALVLLGLAGTLTSLLIFHPLSFIGFIVVGVLVLLFANIYFLYALIRGTGRARATEPAANTVEPAKKPEFDEALVMAP